jgi:hypothetical protein
MIKMMTLNQNLKPINFLEPLERFKIKMTPNEFIRMVNDSTTNLTITINKERQKIIYDSYLEDPIIDGIIGKIICDLFYDILNGRQILVNNREKYVNIYTKLSQLSESLSNFYPPIGLGGNSHYNDVTDTIASIQTVLTKVMFEANRSDSSDTEDGQIKNLCTVCGIDMGDTNPRQLCRKTYCPEQLDC